MVRVVNALNIIILSFMNLPHRRLISFYLDWLHCDSPCPHFILPHYLLARPPSICGIFFIWLLGEYFIVPAVFRLMCSHVYFSIILFVAQYCSRFAQTVLGMLITFVLLSLSSFIRNLFSLCCLFYCSR